MPAGWRGNSRCFLRVGRAWAQLCKTFAGNIPPGGVEFQVRLWIIQATVVVFHRSGETRPPAPAKFHNRRGQIHAATDVRCVLLARRLP